jgi:transposase
MNFAEIVSIIMSLLISAIDTPMITAIEFILRKIVPITQYELLISGRLRRLCLSALRAIRRNICLDIFRKRHILQYISITTLTPVTKIKRSAKAERLKQNESLNIHPERVSAPHFRHSVFFDVQDLVQVKYEMLRQVSHEGTPKAQAAAMYGMSRPTLYQAMNAFNRDGVAGLLPQRRGPKGAHKLTDEVMQFVAGRQAENPTLHARALAKALRDEKHIAVHPRSIERALERKKKR